MSKCKLVQNNSAFVRLSFHEKYILSQLESTWNHYCRSYRPLSANRRRSVFGKLKALFINFDHSTTLNIRAQSMFIAIWTFVDIKYALNYLLMDELCTEVDVFSIAVLVKVMSISSGAYYHRLIKQIWSAILQNDAMLHTMMNLGGRNMASHSMLALADHDAQINTIMSLLKAADGTKQIFMQKTLTAILKRLLNVDTEYRSAYNWAVQVIWRKSTSKVFDSLFDPIQRLEFVELMIKACELFDLPELKLQVLQRAKKTV